MNHDNKPLTLEELRQMEGKPLWFENISNPKRNGWKVAEHGGIDFLISFTDGSYEFSSEYGKTWMAYEQKPEDLLTRADKAMEDTIALYLIEHDADDRKRWRSFNKLIHQRKQQLESAQQQLEGILDMFEREYRMI